LGRGRERHSLFCTEQMATTADSCNTWDSLPMWTVFSRFEDGSEREQTYWAKVIQVWDVARGRNVEAGESTGHYRVDAHGSTGETWCSGEKLLHFQIRE